MLVIEITLSTPDKTTLKAIDAVVEEFNLNVKTYDDRRDVDVQIERDDPREIAIKFFTLSLNHPHIRGIRFKKL